MPDAVAWVDHRGKPVCMSCGDREIRDELLQQLFRRAGLGKRPSTASHCDGDCGRVVLDQRNRGQEMQVCSAQCRRKVLNERRRMDRRARLETPPSERCAECDAVLQSTRSDKKYCSTSCRVRAHRRRRREASP